MIRIFQIWATESSSTLARTQRFLTFRVSRSLGRSPIPIYVRGLSGDEVTVTIRTATGEQKIGGSDLLVAVGRIPNTDDIGLSQAGVEVDAGGYIRVNGRLETTAPGVWAIGECAGSPVQTAMLAELPYQRLRDAVISHLTIAEGLGRLLSNVPPRSAD